ncbi:Uncharacterised protein [Vibrio cholerae]|nr:Uncharacterised protein [Vibrio cholerae]
MFNQIASINARTIHTTCNSCFRKTRTDRLGNFESRYWVVKMTLTTVRKSNNRHVLSLQWCCTPSNTCVKKYALNSMLYEFCVTIFEDLVQILVQIRMHQLKYLDCILTNRHESAINITKAQKQNTPT